MVHNANEIVPGLWVGDQHAAQDPYFFSKYQIKAVVNVTKDIPNAFAKHGVIYLRIPVDDSLKREDINKMTMYLPKAMEFLRQQHLIRGKNVLVHCHAGIQRSATVTVAYLHAFYKKTIPEAIHQVISRRPVAFFGGVHFNFKDSLKKFTRQLKNKK